jgi:uroporphyrinogen III methyltransferase/synthase
VTVYLVGAGPGDPGLLTRRAADLLSRADVVLHDRLVSPAVLDLVPSGAEVIDVGKDPGVAPALARRPEGAVDAAAPRGQRDHQEEISRLLVDRGRRSAVVVRLKGGDPFLFGRGGEEAEALTEAGIDWEVVPGVSSAFGVPAALGIPVTQRGVASSVTVVTGRVGDPDAGAPDWDALARAGGTLVILMGMTTRAAIAEALVRGGRPPETPVAVIENGTTAAQRSARTTLAGLAGVELGSPAVIVVGPVAALGRTDPASGPDRLGPARPLTGRTVVVTRAGPRARALVDAVQSEGARVVELPLTQQVDPADGGTALRAAADRLGGYAWVVLTSVNAVERLMDAVRDARSLAAVRVAVVGPATATAMRRAGVEPDLMPVAHHARALVEAFPQPRATSTRVLFPCADLADDTVTEGLGAKGWEVERVEAYRTVPLGAPAPAVLERVVAADAVVFTATSSVRAYGALRRTGGEAVTVPPVVVCIGATTAAAAVEEGMAGISRPPEATPTAIVDELVTRLATSTATPRGEADGDVP